MAVTIRQLRESSDTLARAKANYPHMQKFWAGTKENPVVGTNAWDEWYRERKAKKQQKQSAPVKEDILIEDMPNPKEPRPFKEIRSQSKSAGRTATGEPANAIDTEPRLKLGRDANRMGRLGR